MYNKRLDEEQLQTLISKAGSSNPLWLTLACEELRVYGTFENLAEKIESLPNDLIRLVTTHWFYVDFLKSLFQRVNHCCSPIENSTILIEP